MTTWRAKSILGLAALSLPLAAAAPAAAQQAPWSTDAPRPQAQAQPKAPAKGPQAQPAAQPKAAAKEEAAPRSGDGQLRQRIEQLEEQIADMQVTIGTLESLGKGSAGGAPAQATRVSASGGSGVDGARLDSLETQIRALSAQVEQLTAQMRQAGRRADLPAAEPAPLRPEPAEPRRTASAEPGAGGFGSITVTPGGGVDRDPIGRILGEPSQPGAGGPAPSQPLPPAAAGAGNPKELYETAYGYLLQQDYGAAEVAFEEFLRRYPSDRQVADAQYWYGETLYVQRRYKQAGQAFLRVIERHQASAKVPNSLLKLAMSLEQLGQKDCTLFSELETKHANAPADVRTRARTMKQRVGC